MRRISILGPSGSGKSTLAKAIGARLGIKVVHLDSLIWRPGWVLVDEQTFMASVRDAIRGEAWVMDGNFTRAHAERLPRSDTIIWLDLPRHVYFCSVLWRILTGLGRARDDVGPGCPERLDFEFLKYVWDYPKNRRGQAQESLRLYGSGKAVHILRSRAEVNRFIRDLGSRPPSRATAAV